jgi:histone H3/H4
VQKIVGEILSSSAGIAFSKEARDVLIECCVEFITLISSEANEISEKETKKTIACDHIIKALDQLGFPDYVPAVLEAAAEHKEVQKVREPNFLFTNCRKLTKRTRDAKRRQINLSRAASALRNSNVCSKNSLLRPQRGTTKQHACGGEEPLHQVCTTKQRR